MGVLVNTLIIGTQKSGTTSLYEYIKQHPEVNFSKIKEVTFFVDDRYYKKGIEYYHSYFNNSERRKITASAYVHMLPSKKCPKRVLAYNPNMKFIVLLREPWSRAHSAFRYAVKNGWEKDAKTLSDSLELEPSRLLNEQFDLTYLYNGKYFEHLNHWMKWFNRSNFFIAYDEDLKNNPDVTLKRLCNFLAIDSEFRFNTEQQFNISGTVRSKFLQQFLLARGNRLKTMLGKLLPHDYKAWIRSNIFRRLIQWNQITGITDRNSTLTKKSDYFQEDQNKLMSLLEKMKHAK